MAWFAVELEIIVLGSTRLLVIFSSHIFFSCEADLLRTNIQAALDQIRAALA